MITFSPHINSSVNSSTDNFHKNTDNKKDIKDNPKLQQEILKLEKRDAHVKAHEMAHKSAGGELAGSASYTYKTGPDGKRYAVGGEVPIAIKKGNTPEETIANMEIVKAAALAPSDPSAQDLKVAATAEMIETEARMKEHEHKKHLDIKV